MVFLWYPEGIQEPRVLWSSNPASGVPAFQDLKSTVKFADVAGLEQAKAWRDRWGDMFQGYPIVLNIIEHMWISNDLHEKQGRSQPSTSSTKKTWGCEMDVETPLGS